MARATEEELEESKEIAKRRKDGNQANANLARQERLENLAATGVNTQRRRRRRRRRRNARGRGNKRRQNRNVNNNNNRNNANVHPYSNVLDGKHVTNFRGSNFQITDAFKHYAEAIVNPFSNAAIGACRPDPHDSLTCPCYDVLTAQFDPNFLDPTNTRTFSQIAFILFPRNLRTGWVDGRYNSTDNNTLTFVRHFPLLPNFGSVLNTTPNITQAYTVMVVGLSDQAVNDGGYFCLNTATNTASSGIPSFNLVTMPRFQRISDNMDGMRILGAGMKIWPTSPPINTGGIAQAGSIRSADLLNSIRGINNGVQAVALTTLLKKRYRCPAIDGATVRYNSIGSNVQYSYAIPEVEFASFAANQNGSQIMNFESNQDPAVEDLATKDTLLPIIIWQYENPQSKYNLNIEVRFHIEGQPDGACPFMRQNCMADPLLGFQLPMLMNFNAYPLATKGHSFKSFLSQTAHLINKGSKIGRQLAQFLSFAHGML